MDIQKLIDLDAELISLGREASEEWHRADAWREDCVSAEEEEYSIRTCRSMETRMTLCHALRQAIRHAVHPVYAESEADWLDFVDGRY